MWSIKLPGSPAARRERESNRQRKRETIDNSASTDMSMDMDNLQFPEPVILRQGIERQDLEQTQTSVLVRNSGESRTRQDAEAMKMAKDV